MNVFIALKGTHFLILFASSETEQMTMKQRESAKLKESTMIGKREPRDHHQSRHSKVDLFYWQQTVESKYWSNQPSKNTPKHMSLALTGHFY